jgi:hypothetical protein
MTNEMSELAKELQLQLESDLLEFWWILSVAKDFESGVVGPPITDVVYDVIVKLLTQGVAEVGDARLLGGRVEFYPWPGTLEERKTRLKQEIQRLGTTATMGEGFWLAKTNG